jgi:hypothetical protein
MEGEAMSEKLDRMTDERLDNLIAERDSARARLRRLEKTEHLAKFGGLVWHWMKTQEDDLLEFAEVELLPLAEECGLCARAEYDPEVHEPLFSFPAPGDECWVYNACGREVEDA